MLTYDDLAQAASQIDAQSDGSLPLEKIFSRVGLDLDGAVRGAEQRALRMVLIQRNPSPEELHRLTDTMSYVKLTTDEQEQFKTFITTWLDGCVVALRAAANKED